MFQLVLIVQALCSTWSVSQYQVPSFQLQHWCSRCRCSYVVPFLSSSPVQIQHIECQLPSEDCLDLFSQTGISSSEFLQPCNHFHIIFVKCSLKACVCVCVFFFFFLNYQYPPVRDYPKKKINKKTNPPNPNTTAVNILGKPLF